MLIIFILVQAAAKQTKVRGGKSTVVRTIGGAGAHKQDAANQTNNKLGIQPKQ